VVITINVPVVYMARDIMILMRAISITGTLEEMGPKIANASKDKMIRTCIWPKLKKPSSKEFVFQSNFCLEREKNFDKRIKI
jgi:hypothetical protein